MLEAGDIFRIRDFHNTGYNPHYQIVVHKTAKNKLLLVYTTTKTDKVKNRCMRDNPHTPEGELPKAYVEIPKGSCTALPEFCVVSCDNAFVSTVEDRENGMDFEKKQNKVPAKLIEKIKEGIQDSGKLPGVIKDVLNE
jgi:hypothetical protein